MPHVLAFAPAPAPCASRPTHGVLSPRRPRRCRACAARPADSASLAARLASDDQRDVMPLLATLERDDVEALRESGALCSPNRAIRASAFAALGRIGTLDDTETLLDVLCGQDDLSVRSACASALGELHAALGNAAPQTVVDVLCQHADGGEEQYIVRYACITALGTIGGSSAIATLVAIHRTPLEVAGAVAALTDAPDTWRSNDIVQYILPLRHHEDDLVRGAVARALGVWLRSGAPSEYTDLLQQMLTDEEQGQNSLHVRNMLAQALLSSNLFEPPAN